MARKVQVSIQDSIESEHEFIHYLAQHSDKLICMEVYSGFCGHCLATQYALRRGKLEIGGDNITMVKCLADHIPALARFRNKSEPVFLFIYKGKLTRAMFGANSIELIGIIEQELGHLKSEQQGIPAFSRHEIDELLPEEAVKMEEDRKIEEEHIVAAERLRVLTVAKRKRRLAERMMFPLRHINFIVFWPHCRRAHYELYMLWDIIDVTVAAKEEIQFTPELAKEVLYMSDVEPNEACIHALCDGEAIVVLFKMFERDERDFVELMRHTLYEMIPEPKEDVPPDMQPPLLPAYERYASISKPARQVRRDRYNAHQERLRLEQEERDRIEAERARLERQEEEDRVRAEKQRKDEERLARMQAGLPPEPEPGEGEEAPLEAEAVEGEAVEGETVEGEAVQGEAVGGESVEKETVKEETVNPEGITGEEGRERVEKAETEATEITEGTDVPEGEQIAEKPTEDAPAEEPPVVGEGEGDMPEVVEEKVEEEEVFHSDVEVEDEPYIPPEGLFIPGLYTPPTNLAKANALTHLFPKVVINLTQTPIETEYLPPHVLVMFLVEKRHEVKEVINLFPSEILNYGVFEGEDLFSAQHLAYTIKQYDKMDREITTRDRLALAVSRKRSLPLLQLAGLNPTYISSDEESGERDCLTLFPVGYGDEYIEEPSVQEEEIEIEPVKAPVIIEAVAPEVVSEEEQVPVDEVDLALANEAESAVSMASTPKVAELPASKAPASEAPTAETAAVKAPKAEASAAAASAAEPASIVATEASAKDSAATEAPTAVKVPDAKVPDAKAPDAKASDAKGSTAKIPAAEAPDAKASKAKGSAAKIPVPEVPAAETPDSKAPDAKSSDAKGSAAKIPIPEAPDTKASDAKGSTAKIPAAEAPGAKASKAKGSAAKIPVPEVPAAKTPDSKAPDVKSSDAKGSAAKISIPEAPVTKASDDQGSTAKIPVPEAPDTKASDAKGSTAKIPVSEAPDTKAPAAVVSAAKVPAATSTAEVPAVETPPKQPAAPVENPQ